MTDLEKVTDHFGKILDVLTPDWRDDPNTDETPQRWAKMMLHEALVGSRMEPPPIKDFPNEKLDQLYCVGPIVVRSLCAHHFAPIMGQAWIGVYPGERVNGLSKFHRITYWVMRRPIIQEEATVRLADAIDERVSPKGLAVLVRAKHFCLAWREG